MKQLATAILLFAASATVTAPAPAAALAKACMTRPTALPKDRCICYEHELQKVLTPAEMRIQILSFRGKYNEFRKKIHSMTPTEAGSFIKRVNNVVHGTVCNH